MQWVGLLRGINVGGKNKVEMARLREALTDGGFADVRTYIASGNILLSSSSRSAAVVADNIEHVIREEFGLEVPALVRTGRNVRAVAASIPEHWANDDDHKCDVLYLWKNVDRPSVLDVLELRDGIDEVIHAHGALCWRVPRKRWGRSGMSRVAANPIYQSMTVRNVNTARKLAVLVDQ